MTYAELNAVLGAGDMDRATRQVIVGARDTGIEAILEVSLHGLAPFIKFLAAGTNGDKKLISAIVDRLTASLISIEVGEPIDRSVDIHGVCDSWRIDEMEVWRRDYVDMDVQAFIVFGSDKVGQFQFGLVQGDMHYFAVERDGQPGVEWSWAGVDDDDEVCGRGWAIVSGDRLTGRIYIHRGDHSAFSATRSPKLR